MIRSLVLGSLLGLFSGMIPGPFSALIAVTALKAGFRAGFWIAVVPLVSETVVLVVTALLLSHLPTEALRWMGIIGGLFVFYLSARTWKDSSDPPIAEPLGGSTRQILEGALLAILSPAPWVFWLLVGAPLFLASWHAGHASGVVFFTAFLAGLVGVHLGVAAVAGYGRKKLSPVWYRRLLRGAAGALMVAGGVLLWQSWIGNFHRMVEGSETIETIVGDSILPRS